MGRWQEAQVTVDVDIVVVVGREKETLIAGSRGAVKTEASGTESEREMISVTAGLIGGEVLSETGDVNRDD